MKTLIISVFFFSSFVQAAATKQEIAEAKKSIQSLIRPLIPGGEKQLPKELGDFRVDACERHKIKWMDVLLMKTRPTLTYSYKEGCDLQGSIQPLPFKSFPANLDLRHLESYNRIETENKITASFETKPLLELEMREGNLRGKKGIVKFEADYKVRINPMNKDKMVDENLGGEIRISEIYGERVSIKETIKIE